MEFCRKGKTFVEGLKEAARDPVVKERFFTTPLAYEAVMHATKRSAPPPPAPYGAGGWTNEHGRPQKKRKGGGGENRFGENRFQNNGKGTHRGPKGKGKGKKGGKGNNKGLGCRRETSEGKPICYAFNNQGCTSAGCTFLHEWLTGAHVKKPHRGQRSSERITSHRALTEAESLQVHLL